jgi:predicted O-methyltransferase YrrM
VVRRTTRDTWTKVDDYIVDVMVRPDASLEAALKDSAKAGLPHINVSAPQGKLLHIFAKMVDASRILEIGTLGGYSTIWLASALPKDGRLISLELEKKHAEVATKNIKRAGLMDKVEIRLGRAIDSLPELLAEKVGPFDLIFIDADKPGNPDYFRWAVKLSRVGTAIIVDNVVRDGAVLEEKSSDEDVQGVRKLNEVIAAEKRVTATTIQTVGSKGYDGFAIAVVTR